jgi:hypothetical protein
METTGSGEVDASGETGGLLFGALGVLAFSVTLPATRLAVADLGKTRLRCG